NPPTFVPSRRSRVAPLSRAFAWGPETVPNPPTFVPTRRTRVALLSRAMRGGSLGLGAFLGELTFRADPGAHHDLGLVVPSQRPRNERDLPAPRTPLRSCARRQMRRQPRHLGCHAADDSTQTLGSRASRRRSPTRLIASTVARIARPGKVGSHHATLTKSRPSAIIWPHVGYVRPEPTPRKESA